MRRHGEFEVGRLDAVVARVLDVLVVNFDFQRGRVDGVDVHISTGTSVARSGTEERRTFNVRALDVDQGEEEVLGALYRALARDRAAAEVSGQEEDGAVLGYVAQVTCGIERGVGIRGKTKNVLPPFGSPLAVRFASDSFEQWHDEWVALLFRSTAVRVDEEDQARRKCEEKKGRIESSFHSRRTVLIYMYGPEREHEKWLHTNFSQCNAP